MKSSLKKRIEKTNELLQHAIDLELYIIIDWGSTIDNLYTFQLPLKIRNQFVYFRYTEQWGRYRNETQRFNTNDEDHVSDLKFTLTHLNRALKKAINAYTKRKVGIEIV